MTEKPRFGCAQTYNPVGQRGLQAASRVLFCLLSLAPQQEKAWPPSQMS